MTTLERRHVHRHGDLLVFEFVAKSGVSQHIEIVDPLVLASVEAMRRRRDTAETLLAYRQGRRWRSLSAGDVNDYLKNLLGGEVSAKDFRRAERIPLGDVRRVEHEERAVLWLIGAGAKAPSLTVSGRRSAAA